MSRSFNFDEFDRAEQRRIDGAKADADWAREEMRRRIACGPHHHYRAAGMCPLCGKKLHE